MTLAYSATANLHFILLFTNIAQASSYWPDLAFSNHYIHLNPTPFLVISKHSKVHFNFVSQLWLEHSMKFWHIFQLNLRDWNLRSWLCDLNFKRMVYPKLKIISPFTHPLLVPYLFDFLYCVEHIRRCLNESWRPVIVDFHSICLSKCRSKELPVFSFL